ncbi:hypothetical protein NML04_12075 [Clostridium perfringens]|uniref:hypothetical protein n=1 Tax=Clostridium perfringens TaxID=1502 RepID=UPI0020938AD3|nr:hypothetical protein [Clostridium perfringens]MCO6002707.1 hypothetical protein [Clostridium perfringens]MCO7395452.1 hypothetical protein [Clostridium perfringens]MCP8916408.1 hypothetical protein [Clostridium perfringens]MCP8966165.1 hypothetical protein [Clostridium perfringens]
MISLNYTERLKKLKERRTDTDVVNNMFLENYLSKEYFVENYEKVNEKDIYKYILGAMEEVDNIYTKNTFLEAERVTNQLDKIKNSNLNFEYRYQGSVSNNTHIKAHSDIDILVIIDKFVTLENPQKPINPYKGNPVKDLYELRINCEEHLKKAFYKAEVNCDGAKSISLKGGSLKRKIDVVPSNWFNTNMYKELGEEKFRGVQVLDKFTQKRIKNTPFYHNYLLEEKDLKCCGNFRRLVRFVKTLKADSENEINFSSYDITALIYNMNDSDFLVENKYLMLIKNFKNYVEYVIQDSEYRKALYVPDRSRKIFVKDNSLEELKKLKNEVDMIFNEISKDLYFSSISLENKSFSI